MFGLTSGTNMRGLNEFISDIRACKDKESQTKRVQIQLAKIRQCFTIEKGVNAYTRKKYIWKLLYIHILGYEIDFGFTQAASLINSSKYDQKYTGYIASSLLINDQNDSIWKSIVHSIDSDIKSRNQATQSLAYSMIATIVPDVLVNTLSDTILTLAIGNKISTTVRRKAMMCLARILKKYPNKYDSKQFLNPLLDMFEPRATSLSFTSSACTLLLTLLQLHSPEYYRALQPKIIRILHKLAITKQCPIGYVYYASSNPWLQMKLYKALQIWSPPPQKAMLSLSQEIMNKVLKNINTSKSINKNNIEYGLLFEAINLVILYDDKIDRKLTNDVCKILVIFITSTQANIRYLGLQAMCRIAIKNDMSQHQNKILSNLDDGDISIRRRALDLLYLICNIKNVNLIVAQLLGYLQNRNDPLMQDDLVLKIAILAQKFAQNPIWYIDVVVKLIENVEVQNQIWFRIIQIITGFGQVNINLQNYAAQKLYISLNVPFITQTLKCVGSYVISQFSQYLIKTGKQPRKIFQVVYRHFQNANSKSKGMMLNSFLKLGIKYPILKEQIQMIFHLCSQHWDTNVQQRGIQFLAIFLQDQKIQNQVILQNPTFKEEQQQSNPLLKKFAQRGKKMKQSGVRSKLKKEQFQTTVNNASSHPLSTHPCFKKAVGKLCPNLINLIDIPGKLEIKPYFKEALVKNKPFEQCEVKSKLQSGVLKVFLSVHVQATEMQFKVFHSKGLQIKKNTINYGPQAQQIDLSMIPNGDKIEPPKVAVAWKSNGQIIKKQQLQLPILITKYLEPVDLNWQTFSNFYKEYSLANEKFHKLDSFLKIPQNVKGHDYLKKIGAFLSTIGNFNCHFMPSVDNIQLIYGAANFTLKLQNKSIKIPIIIEAEHYEVDGKKAVRVSLRGANSNVLISVYQSLIIFF